MQETPGTASVQLWDGTFRTAPARAVGGHGLLPNLRGMGVHAYPRGRPIRMRGRGRVPWGNTRIAFCTTHCCGRDAHAPVPPPGRPSRRSARPLRPLTLPSLSPADCGSRGGPSRCGSLHPIGPLHAHALTRPFPGFVRSEPFVYQQGTHTHAHSTRATTTCHEPIPPPLK